MKIDWEEKMQKQKARDLFTWLIDMKIRRLTQ